MARSVKEYKQSFPARREYVCAQDQVSRLIDDGSVSEEDVVTALELHGYGGLFGDDEKVPPDVWDRVLGDINALLKLRAHMAKEQKALDRAAAQKMH